MWCVCRVQETSNDIADQRRAAWPRAIYLIYEASGSKDPRDARTKRLVQAAWCAVNSLAGSNDGKTPCTCLANLMHQCPHKGNRHPYRHLFIVCEHETLACRALGVPFPVTILSYERAQQLVPDLPSVVFVCMVQAEQFVLKAYYRYFLRPFWESKTETKHTVVAWARRPIIRCKKNIDNGHIRPYLNQVKMYR